MFDFVANHIGMSIFIGWIVLAIIVSLFMGKFIAYGMGSDNPVGPDTTTPRSAPKHNIDIDLS